MSWLIKKIIRSLKMMDNSNEETYTVNRATGEICFGDGIRGERPPIGRENIEATYRNGLGLDGLITGIEVSRENNYFYGRLMTAEDFQSEQDYFTSKLEALKRIMLSESDSSHTVDKLRVDVLRYLILVDLAAQLGLEIKDKAKVKVSDKMICIKIE